MAQEQKKGNGSGPKQIRDVMTANPHTVSATDSIQDVARIMKEQDTGVVPVVDGKKILGLVTDRDLVVRLLAEGRNPADAKISDVMTKGVRSVKDDASVDDVLDLMATAEVRRVPVVNHNDEIVGIVSIGDISVDSNRDTKVSKTLEDISAARPNN